MAGLFGGLLVMVVALVAILSRFTSSRPGAGDAVSTPAPPIAPKEVQTPTAPRMTTPAVSPITPEEVLVMMNDADQKRDAYAKAQHYAPIVRFFSSTKTNGELLKTWLKTYQKYYLKYESQIDNITTSYNPDGSAAAVEYDLYAYTQTSSQVWYCNVRKRLIMHKYDGRWKIDCEEDILIRETSNPKALPTNRCTF